MSRSDKKFVRTSYGQIACLEAGDPKNPPILFVHGIPTSSFLWRQVICLLQDEFHCIAPDLMGLGDTEVDPETTAFHMAAQAEMLGEFMTELGLEQFSIVCHDQGGAAAQLLATAWPDRVRSMVLTDCVCYDNWPVPAIAQLQGLMGIPILPDLSFRLGIWEYIETRSPLSKFRRGLWDPSKLASETILEYLRPLRESDASRRRFQKFLLAGHERYTLEVVPALRTFPRPALVVWAADDRYISPSWGARLHEDLPHSEGLEIIPFCGHFWQEERPAEFVSKMRPFLRRYGGAQDETERC